MWARPGKFALKLKEYLIEYGDLKNYLFKVKRHGAPGDMQTDYELIPILNKDIYKDSVYVKDFSAFNTLDLTKHSYYDLSFDEVKYFVETGELIKANNTTNNNQIQENVQQNKNVSFNVEQDLPFDTPVPQNNINNAFAQAEQNPFATNQVQPQVNNYQQQIQPEQQVTNSNGRRIYKY